MKKVANTSNNSRNTRETWVHSRRNQGTALIVLLLLLAIWMLGKIADPSTPKDMLYPVDRGMETLQSAVTLTPQTRAKLSLDFFNERQHEAESLVLLSDFNVCDAQVAASTSENDQAIMIALNDSQQDLLHVEAEILQVSDASVKEELNANVVEVVGHHLLIWQSLSKYAPTQAHSAIVQVTERMIISLSNALAALPEGRREDMSNKLQFDLATIGADIQNGLGLCRAGAGAEDGDESNGAGTNGNGNGTGNGTGSNGSGSNVRTNTGAGSAGTAGRPGAAGSAGGTGAGGSNGGANNRGGTNINVNSEAGTNIDAGVNNQGQIYLEPTINPSADNGTDTEASINDSTVVDTACTGAQVLGVCL